ncbi:MAG TPA: hypothetical protein VIT44_07180 [Cyclobacteriaceae bacterium]
MEKRWTGAELSGGKFCEIVYTILDGHAKAAYATSPSKPANFVDACKKLESNTHVPRSFQILIPRMLPALYEIRNNRSVGHVGGDVDPNAMDANAVVSLGSWIIGELIRVLHNTTTSKAQEIVDFITNRKIPLVWETNNVRRVLDPKLKLNNQILLLVASNNAKTKIEELINWIESKDKAYFMKTIRKLHKDRQLNISSDNKEVEILPPGTLQVEKLISKLG